MRVLFTGDSIMSEDLLNNFECVRLVIGRCVHAGLPSRLDLDRVTCRGFGKDNDVGVERECEECAWGLRVGQ